VTDAATAAPISRVAFCVANSLSVTTQESCSRMFVCSYRYWFKPARLRVRRKVSSCRLGSSGDDDAVEVQLLDLLFDHGLARIGTRKHVGRRDHDARNAADFLRHALDVHHVGDVPTAVADEDADPRLSRSAFQKPARPACCRSYPLLPSTLRVSASAARAGLRDRRCPVASAMAEGPTVRDHRCDAI